jgi:hypothetical protein
MTAGEMVSKCQRMTPRQLIAYAKSRETIYLSQCERIGLEVALASAYEAALDLLDFDNAALDFDPDNATPDVQAEVIQCHECKCRGNGRGWLIKDGGRFRLCPKCCVENGYDRPIVAEAVQCEDVGDWSNRVKTECKVAMMWPGSCGLGTFGCTNPEHYAATASQPRQSTFAETYSRIDRQLSRARRLHQPATQEDTALAELERNFQIP